MIITRDTKQVNTPASSGQTPLWRRLSFYKTERSQNLKLLCCKSWRCPRCSRILRKKYASKIHAIVELNEFYTYSRGRKGISLWTLGTSLKLAQLETFRSFWDKFRRIYIDVRGIKYISVLEPGEKSGHLHLHIIFNSRQEHEEVLEAWRSVTGEKSNVNFEWMSAEKAGPAWYMAKYLSKGAESTADRFESLRYRKLRYSQGLQQAEEKERGEIQVIETGIDTGGLKPFSYLLQKLENGELTLNSTLLIEPRIHPVTGEVCDFEASYL